MSGLLRGRWLWFNLLQGLGEGQGEACVSGVGGDVTMGRGVPGLGTIEPPPGVNRTLRLQRRGRLRHYTAGKAGKTL